MGINFIGNPYEQDYEDDDNELGDYSEITYMEPDDEGDFLQEVEESNDNDSEDDPAEDPDYDPDDEIDLYDLVFEPSDNISIDDSDEDIDEIDYVTFPINDQLSEYVKTSDADATVADTDSD